MLRLLFVFVLVVSVAQTKAAADVDLDTLSLWFGGRFTNLRQAGADSSIPPLNLRITRLWKERSDGMWFLSELTSADAHNIVIGTIVYRINRIEEGMIEVIPFSIRDSVTRFDGDSAKLSTLSTSGLDPQPGCELYLQPTGSSFFGGTHGTGCAERVGKASYKSTDLNIVVRGLVWTTRTYAVDGSVMLTLRFIFDRRK